LASVFKRRETLLSRLASSWLSIPFYAHQFPAFPRSHSTFRMGISSRSTPRVPQVMSILSVQLLQSFTIYYTANIGETSNPPIRLSPGAHYAQNQVPEPIVIREDVR
jgi:hypothetical protein